MCNNFVNAQVARVDDYRARCLDERAIGPLRVLAVTTDYRRLDLIDIATEFRYAAFGTHTGRRGYIQLERRVWEHHRSNIAAFHYTAAALRYPGTLPSNHLGAYSAVGGDRTHGRRHLTTSNLNGRINTVNEHSRLIDSYLDLLGERPDGFQVRRVDAATQGRERYRSVHRTSVEIVEVQLFRHRTADGALTCTRWAINRDNYRGR
jgi:hypothetical protein